MALETLIHIGYHKTASTWLQTHILDNPETRLKRFFSKKDIRDFIVLPHSLDFNSIAVRTHHLKLMKQAIEGENLAEDTISVISSEDFQVIHIQVAMIVKRLLIDSKPASLMAKCS